MAAKLNAKFCVLLVSVIAIVWKFIVYGESTEVGTKINLTLDTVLNFTEIIKGYGYHFEKHEVVTEDGYVLTLFRLVNANHCVGKLHKPPVILEHGLLQSSVAWLDAGPNAGLAYLLADACYDVWVGNQRGNYYTRRHKHLSPNDPEFWNFSLDEIGYYDIPATVDFVLESTGADKVNYVGYSQGASSFLIMCSEKLEYSDKINVMIALAPAIRISNTKSIILRSLFNGFVYFESVLRAAGIFEIFSKASTIQELPKYLCQFKMLSTYICRTAIALIDSNHPGSISDETFSNMCHHFPAGTSLKTFIRYGQNMNSWQFQKYDYGIDNLKIYFDKSPPVYNFKAVTAPVVVFYGKSDNLVDTKDVFWLVKKLPNVKEIVEIGDPLWNHFDFIYSKYVSEFVFPKINQYLQQFAIPEETV